MNCREVICRADLYLSGETDPWDRDAFAAHLAGCPSCEQEIERLEQLNARLAEVLGKELPDAARLVESTRERISALQRRRRAALAGGIAAAILLLAAATYGVTQLVPSPRLYAEAAQDHRAEVIDRQPRRWRTGAAAIETATQQHGLSFARASALAPEGYSLVRAKNCGLDGQRMLHLIFSDGMREYSVYLRTHRSLNGPVRMIQRDGERVAGFETGRFRALVVTGGEQLDCEALARNVKQRL